MRFSRPFALATPMLLVAAPLYAQTGAGEGSSLMSLKSNLMFWTLVIFLLLFFVLTKYAFKPITAAVEEREKALEDALASAKRDREEAERILAEHRAKIEAARSDAQKVIADARATAEEMRNDILAKARAEQQATVERAAEEIQREKERAVAELRREAVEMAILGAAKVIEQNLDTEKNRQLVEGYLSTIKPSSVTH